MKDLIQGYRLTSTQPIDDRLVVSNDSERTSLPVKYTGLRVFQTDTRQGWFWDGNSWYEDEGRTGPQGLIGTTGSMGITTGLQGTQGTIGIQGSTGLLTGPQGPQGLQSVLVGAPGIRGIRGTNGITGPTGPQGPDSITSGPQGPDGPLGLQGLRGPTGSTGFSGPQGDAGVQGLIGQRGVTGPQGPTGNQGVQGQVGTQGVTGPTGPGINIGLSGSFALSPTMSFPVDSPDSWKFPALYNPVNHYDIRLPAARRLADGQLIKIEEVYDDDNSYDHTTGIWTCPLTGLYDISFSVVIENLTLSSIGDEGQVIIAGVTDPPTPGSGLYYTHDHVNTIGNTCNEVHLSGMSNMTPLCAGERLCLKISNTLGYDLTTSNSTISTAMSVRKIKNLTECNKCIPELDGITVTLGTRFYEENSIPLPTASFVTSQHFPASYDSLPNGLSNRWVVDFPSSFSGIIGATLSIEYNISSIQGGPTSGGGGYWELIVATAGGYDVYAYSQTLLGNYHTLNSKSSPLYVSVYCGSIDPVCLRVDYNGDITNHTSYYGTIHFINYPNDPLTGKFFSNDISDFNYPYFLSYDNNTNEWTLMGGSTSLPGWNGATFGLSGAGFSPYYDALMTYPWHVDMTVTDSDAIPFIPHPNQNFLFSTIPNPPIGTFSIINSITPSIGTWSVSTTQGVC
jgi:hypothetical protein